MVKRQKGKAVKPTSPDQFIRQRARLLPIRECWINSGWKENGLASIIIARKHTNDNFTVGMYLVDLKCLGVKDSIYFFNITSEEYNELFELRTKSAAMIPVPYALVHNIIYAGIEFAEDFGFKPHKEFAVAKYILEEDTDEIEFIEVECGHDGKPFYLRGPLDSDFNANKILVQLEKTAGPGNYGFANELDQDEY